MIVATSTVHQRFLPPEIRILICEYFLLRDWHANANMWPCWRFYHNDRAGATIHHNGEATPILPSEIVAVSPHTLIDRRLSNPVPHFYIHATIGWPYHAYPQGVYRFHAPEWILELIDSVKGQCPRNAQIATDPRRNIKILA
ncbi:MAG: hypothetical protein D6820_00270, partial [Lentisphaerae bacterium]